MIGFGLNDSENIASKKWNNALDNFMIDQLLVLKINHLFKDNRMKIKKILLAAILSFPLIAHAEGLKLKNSTVEFDQYTGQITVSGEYSYYFEDEVLGDVVCFHPYAPSDKLIPRTSNDQRSRWFCFTQSSQAINVFKINKKSKQGYEGYTGHATVTVGDYAVYRGESEGFDTAKLISVKKAEAPKLMKKSGY